MLKEYELPSEALTYLRLCLAKGNALATQMGKLPLDDGRTFTFLPEGVPAEQLLSFEDGGVAEGSIGSVHITVATFVSGYLCGAGSPLAVFENALARTSDPFLRFANEKRFHHRSNVYFFAGSEDSDVPTVDSTIRCAKTYNLVGALTYADLGETPSDGVEVGSETLEKFALRTQCIILGAYDGEGYIIWRKNSMMAWRTPSEVCESRE